MRLTGGIPIFVHDAHFRAHGGSVDWSYVAGYFDGEGHVSLHPAGGKGRGTKRELSWANTDRRSLEAMRAFMGVGRIRMDWKDRPRRRPLYQLAIRRREHLLRVLDLLIPHLIIKAAQARALRENLLAMPASAVRFSEVQGRLTAISTEQFREWYHDRQESCALIAWRLSVTPAAVLLQLQRRGIPRRPVGDRKHTRAA